MTEPRKAVFMLAGIVVSLVSGAYLLAPKGGPAAPRPTSSLKAKADEAAEGLPLKRTSPESDEDFIKVPPQAEIIKRSSTTSGQMIESTLKFESMLSPTELQVYFTDMLVNDWMIPRDDLTEGVGWSGVFMQVEPKEVTMGIFAVVKRIGPPSGRANPTVVSIMKVEER